MGNRDPNLGGQDRTHALSIVQVREDAAVPSTSLMWYLKHWIGDDEVALLAIAAIDRGLLVA